MKIEILKEDESIRKILGKIEIETIIKKIKGKKLKQTERNYLSRSVRPKLMAACVLYKTKVIEKIGKPRNKNQKEQIIYNLSLYNYDLMIPHKIKKQKKLNIDELIGRILMQRSEPRFIEAIPIILIKNKIDPYALLEIAIKYDIQNQIGYLLETSFIIIRKLKIKKPIYLQGLLDYLRKIKNKNIEFLSREPEDKEYAEFLEKTSPKRIKRWNLLGRFYDKDFIKNAKTYLR